MSATPSHEYPKPSRKGQPDWASATDAYEPKQGVEVGVVRQISTKLIIVDIQVRASGIEIDENAEYVLSVNGRPVKRMKHWQARRLFGMK